MKVASTTAKSGNLSPKELQGAANVGSLPLAVIGICTRGRATDLDRLLRCLKSQGGTDQWSYMLLIVDNNPLPSVSSDHCSTASGFPATVVHEPVAGLCSARNRLFDTASDLGAVWIIGIDDDEWVADDWLDRWSRGISMHTADILIGGTELVHPDAGGRFRAKRQYRLPQEGQPSGLLGTCNYAIHESVFSKTAGVGLRFNMLFNHTGGEDGEFMLRAKRTHNIHIQGWPSAKAYEAWDRERATARYAIRRCLHERINFFRIAQLHRAEKLMTFRTPLWQLIIQKSLQSFFSSVLSLGRGLAVITIDREEGEKRIGQAAEDLARAYAPIPFLLGRHKSRYGQ